MDRRFEGRDFTRGPFQVDARPRLPVHPSHFTVALDVAEPHLALRGVMHAHHALLGDLASSYPSPAR